MLKKRWCCNSTLSNFCGTRPRELDSQGPAASHVKSSSGVLFCKAPQSPNNFQDVGENSKRKYVLSKMTPRVPTSEGHNSTSSFRKILPLASSNSRPKTAQVTNFSKDSREVNLSRKGWRVTPTRRQAPSPGNLFFLNRCRLLPSFQKYHSCRG